MKPKHLLKLFIFISLSVLILSGFTRIGDTYNKLFKAGDAFTENTSIGSVDISQKTRKEATNLLLERLETWQVETEITFHLSEKKESFNLDLIQFDVEKSMKQIVEGKDNAVIADIREGDFSVFLENTFPNVDQEQIEMGKLRKALLEAISPLGESSIDFHLYSYGKDNEFNPSIIAESSFRKDEIKTDISYIVEELPTMEIGEDTSFSLLSHLESAHFIGLGSVELSKISTLLYELVLQTNFPVIERTIPSIIKEDTTLGFDMYVNQEEQVDFIFHNPNAQGYTIELAMTDTHVKASLIGLPFAYEYIVEQKNEKNYSPRRIIQYSPLIDEGTVTVKHAGKDGVSIEINRQAFDENDMLIHTEKIARDYYAPMQRIELHPLDDPEERERIEEAKFEREMEEEKEAEKEALDEAMKDYFDEVLDRHINELLLSIIPEDEGIDDINPDEKDEGGMDE